jgi:hypothetical protein
MSGYSSSRPAGWGQSGNRKSNDSRPHEMLGARRREIRWSVRKIIIFQTLSELDTHSTQMPPRQFDIK